MHVSLGYIRLSRGYYKLGGGSMPGIWSKLSLGLQKVSLAYSHQKITSIIINRNYGSSFTLVIRTDRGY